MSQTNVDYFKNLAFDHYRNSGKCTIKFVLYNSMNVDIYYGNE